MYKKLWNLHEIIEEWNAGVGGILMLSLPIFQPIGNLMSNFQRCWERESIGICDEPEEKCVNWRWKRNYFALTLNAKESYFVNLPWKTEGQLFKGSTIIIVQSEANVLATEIAEK